MDETREELRVDGVTLARVRVQRGMTQTALAYASGTSMTTVQRAEASDERISERTAQKLAAALHIDVDAIYHPPGAETNEARCDDSLAPNEPDWARQMRCELEVASKQILDRLDIVLGRLG